MSPAERVTAAELAVLGRRLGDREMAVIETLYRSKLATATQLQRLHFTNYATALTGARAARRTLAHMTDQRLLIRLDRRIGGVRAGSASYIYALGPLAHRMLDGHSRRRWREPSHLFVAHTIAITEVATQLATETPSGCELLELEPEPECWRTFTSGHGTPEVLKPDLAVVTADEVSEFRWFIEIDLGTESGTAIARKAARYRRYHDTGIEQHEHDVFPKVLFVADTDSRAGIIGRTLQRSRRSELFEVCTNNDALPTLYRIRNEGDDG